MYLPIPQAELILSSSNEVDYHFHGFIPLSMYIIIVSYRTFVSWNIPSKTTLPLTQSEGVLFHIRLGAWLPCTK
jgi:hypothetical protein